MHSDRRTGRGQARILYWFRTPPGVKVGRAALDEDAIRLIEKHHPEIEFDWTRILKGGASRRPNDGPRSRHRTPPVPPLSADLSAEASAKAEARRSAGGRPVTPPPVAQATESVKPLAGPTAEAEPEPDVPVTAAGAKLGSEGLARLRGRYAEMLARITDRVPDGDRQAELKTIAERLNPDAWVTDADVLAGLDAYETTFESLRSVVGHRRRRSRRRPAPSPGAGASGTTSPREDPERAE